MFISTDNPNRNIIMYTLEQTIDFQGRKKNDLILVGGWHGNHLQNDLRLNINY